MGHETAKSGKSVRRKTPVPIGTRILDMLLFILTVFMAYPLFVMVINVFKTPLQRADWIALPTQFYTDNIVKVFTKSGFAQSLANSLFITVISIGVLVIFGSMAAYPLGRRKEKVFNALYIYITLGIMLPLQFSILPIFQLIKNLGLMDQRLALILIEIGFNITITVFIYKNFIKSVPIALEEAAIIDGCSYFGVFWRIVFPMLKPATATVIITNLIYVWNDFLGPLLVIQSAAKRTLPIMIISFRGQYGNDIGAVFTTITFASLPMIVLFLCLQQSFYKGISAGAVKS